LALEQFKVIQRHIDIGVNGKLVCYFLLVISNFGPICYRFRDIDA